MRLDNILLFSVRELAERFSRRALEKMMDDFSCSRDRSIEHFIHDEALEFSEEMYGTTYVFLERDSWMRGRLRVMGIFTLAIAATDFSGLSKSQMKKVFGHKTRGKVGPHRGAWLLGQFARADGVAPYELSGKEMYRCVLEVLRSLREASSGRVLVLECAPDLVSVYESYDFKILPQPSDVSSRGLVTMYAIPEPKRSPLYAA